MIARMIPHFVHTWRNARPSLRLTIELITPNQSQHLSLLNRVHPLFLLAHPRKLISLLATISACVSTLMRLMSSSNYLRKVLLWILFSGGRGVVRNSRIYLVWPETYSPSQVCFNYLPLIIIPMCDVLKGSAVAVERIFSGGRDTISLRRASLKAETIRTLMLVKQRLRLARRAIRDILGD